MFPIAATAPTTTLAPPSLVATPLPENFATRVPSTNVAPSVSSVQIYNNTRGNGSYTPIDQVAQYPVPVIEGDEATGAVGGVASSKIPAAFLAQIIGQSVPPSLQGALSNVLASYDQLVANGFVKYRPAQFPQTPQPASVFGKFLAQEQGSPQPVQQQVQAPQPQPVSVAPPAPQNIPVQPAQAAAPEIKQAQPAEKPAPQPQAAAPKKATASPVKGAIAYLMSEARVDFEAPPQIKATM